MIDKDSRVLVTYSLPGSVLVEKGNYTSAKVKVVNGFTDNEVVIKLSPMRVNKAPVEKKTKVSSVLSNAFIQMALETPPQISRRKRMNLKLWEEKSVEERIGYHAELYVESMMGTDCKFEIL